MAHHGTVAACVAIELGLPRSVQTRDDAGIGQHVAQLALVVVAEGGLPARIPVLARPLPDAFLVCGQCHAVVDAVVEGDTRAQRASIAQRSVCVVWVAVAG